MKLQEIFQAYKSMISPTKEQEELAQERLGICNECPARDESLNICKECTCWIPAKVFTNNADSCPRKAANIGGWAK